MSKRWVVALVVLAVVNCGGGGGGGGSPTRVELRYIQFEGTVQRLNDAAPFDLEVVCDQETISGPRTCEEGVCEVLNRTAGFVPAGQHTLDWKIIQHTEVARYAVNGEIVILFGDGGLDQSIPVYAEERLTEGDSIHKAFSF